MNLLRLNRAEYAARPTQLLRRTWRILRRVANPGLMEVRLPWGHPLVLNPRESVGRSIVALDMHDLPVTEAQWRLTDPGEICADVGANIGFATSVFAHLLRQGGKVWSFEPLPEIATRLENNMDRWRPLTAAHLMPWPVALSNTEGGQAIHVPAHFSENQGTASLVVTEQGATRTVSIQTRCLDSLCDESLSFGVMKVDVEGAEAEVFEGANRLLSHHRIRDIIFEEYRPAPAPSFELLQSYGYKIWRVARGKRGPLLLPNNAPFACELDPPTYLASCEPNRVIERFAPPGWQALGS